MKIPAYFPIVAALLCATVSPAQDSEKPRAEMREKMQKIKREIEELRASGRQDEAKRLEERARAEMGKLSAPWASVSRRYRCSSFTSRR